MLILEQTNSSQGVRKKASMVLRLLIITGIEVSSRHGHIIGLGVSDTVPRGLSADETILQIKRLAGVSIVAHPYDFLRSALNPEILTTVPDAIEVINSAS